jgi:flagellar basal body-associated protein FliL
MDKKKTIFIILCLAIFVIIIVSVNVLIAKFEKEAVSPASPVKEKTITENQPSPAGQEKPRPAEEDIGIQFPTENGKLLQ